MKLHYNYKSTTEDLFDTGARFCHCRLIKQGEYEQIGSTEARCRDFLIDPIVGDYFYPHSPMIAVYRFKYHPTGYVKRAKSTRISIYLPHGAASAYLPHGAASASHQQAIQAATGWQAPLYTFTKTKDYLNSIEKTLQIKSTKMFMDENTPRCVFVADKVWSKYPPLISLYTLLIQHGIQYYKKERNIKLTIEKAHTTGIIGNITTGQWLKVIKTPYKHKIVNFIINNIDYIFQDGMLPEYDNNPLKIKDNIQYIHNKGGIVNLVQTALMYKNGKQAPVPYSKYGNAWSNRLGTLLKG